MNFTNPYTLSNQVVLILLQFVLELLRIRRIVLLLLGEPLWVCETFRLILRGDAAEKTASVIVVVDVLALLRCNYS